MIIPARLMKQWPDGLTLDAARGAFDGSHSPSPGAPLGDGQPTSSARYQSDLAAEREFLGRAKRLAIGLLGLAASTYAADFSDAQEVQALIADVMIEVFAIESGILRAEKMAARADRGAALAADAVRVYVSEASDRIATAARQVAGAVSARSGDTSLADRVQVLSRHNGPDTIATRRRIAQAVIDAGKHPF
jgi:hypothetical protein